MLCPLKEMFQWLIKIYFLEIYCRDMYGKLTPSEETNQYEAIRQTGIQNLLIKYNKMAFIKKL